MRNMTYSAIITFFICLPIFAGCISKPKEYYDGYVAVVVPTMTKAVVFAPSESKANVPAPGSEASVPEQQATIPAPIVTVPDSRIKQPVQRGFFRGRSRR